MRGLTNIAWAVIAVTAYLALQSLLDYQDGLYRDRAAYRRWAAESCLPLHADEVAVATLRGNRIDCTVYENATYGRAPVVAAAVTMEIPE